LKSNTQAVGFLLLFAFLFAFCFNSCSPATPDCFAYTGGAFKAQVSGEIDGEKFDATLHFDPHATGNQPVSSVRFRSPSYMSGICVSTLSDGSSSARLGDITVNGVDFERFTSPLSVICSRHDITRIQKNENGTIVALVENEDISLEFVFDSNVNPTPKSIKGSVNDCKITVTVKNFEKN
jgi:hypothetical protein